MAYCGSNGIHTRLHYVIYNAGVRGTAPRWLNLLHTYDIDIRTAKNLSVYKDIDESIKELGL